MRYTSTSAIALVGGASRSASDCNEINTTFDLRFRPFELVEFHCTALRCAPVHSPSALINASDSNPLLSMAGLLKYARPAGGVALLGLLGWTTADALNELLVYRHCQRAALERASDNAELAELLGLPLHPGPWYNASMSLTHNAHIANCQFALVGTKNSSDVYIRAVRGKGPRSTLLYNLVGSAIWHPLLMEASVNAGGGLSKNISLLQNLPSPQAPTHPQTDGV